MQFRHEPTMILKVRMLSIQSLSGRREKFVLGSRTDLSTLPPLQPQQHRADTHQDPTDSSGHADAHVRTCRQFASTIITDAVVSVEVAAGIMMRDEVVGNLVVLVKDIDVDNDFGQTLVAAHWDTSKDWSLLAPEPTGAVELGLRSNQHGVSEPGQLRLTVAVMFPPPTPWCCFSVGGECHVSCLCSCGGICRLRRGCRSRPTLPSPSKQNAYSHGA